jgi:hypothetical protein
MVMTSTSISTMHTSGTSGLEIRKMIRDSNGLDGLVLEVTCHKHTLTPGRWVKLPFNFNIAPETLSPSVTFRR